MRELFAVLLIALIGASSVLCADETGSLLPIIPPAKGDQCVEPTDIMRRQHMDFLLHQRDLTVIDGVRTQQHQLVKCINCHIQANQQGVYPRHTSNEHFCSSCHNFTSVKIDCFECHADRPEEYYKGKMQDANLMSITPHLMNKLAKMPRKK